MPIITVALYSGRPQKDKDRLAEAITDDVVNILKVQRNDVIIVFQESDSWKLVCFRNTSLTIAIWFLYFLVRVFYFE